MTVQFWLWGLDAMHQDLQRRGFEKLPRPGGSECSVYQLESLFIHGFGLWLESNDGVLVYRRPVKTWYALPRGTTPDFEQFTRYGSGWMGETSGATRPKSIPPKRALQQIHSVVLEHERWMAQQHGADWRSSQLARVSHRAVRRAKHAWQDWLEGDA
jgi:hypothetical protein